MSVMWQQVIACVSVLVTVPCTYRVYSDLQFVAIDCGANISNIVGFDGKEIPSSSLVSVM